VVGRDSVEPPNLRIGCVKYLNARPLIRGWPTDVVFDHPSALCAQLARGELDVALVSSFEFLRNPIYRIVDGVSISSDGPVYSVVVAHVGKIADVKEILLDPAAETSGNLLRCLLAELKLRPRLVERSTSARAGARVLTGETSGDEPETAAATAQRARLLIGDQAIRFRQEHANEFQFWDLGANWKRIFGRPFVYALWLVRPEVVDPKSIADRLRALRDQNLQKIDDLIAAEKEFDRGLCDRYYRQHLRFSFGESEKKGLRAFHESCEKHELLPKRDIPFGVV
jgi:chorismate dehydratase